MMTKPVCCCCCGSYPSHLRAPQRWSCIPFGSWFLLLPSIFCTVIVNFCDIDSQYFVLIEGWRDPNRYCRLRDNCASKPCKNGGTCYDDGYRSYSCKCDDNFYGRHCTKRCVSDEYSICDSSGHKSCRPGELKLWLDHRPLHYLTVVKSMKVTI